MLNAELNVHKTLRAFIFFGCSLVPLAYLIDGLSARKTNAETLPGNRTVYANDFGAKCDGAHDDAAGIRAAIAYALSIGQAAVHLAACPNDYLLKSTDPSGLGAVVVGDGVHSDAVNLIGDAFAVDLADKTYRGRVRLYLGDGMNVPAIYFRRNAAITSVENMEIDGNRIHQSGASLAACGNHLYIICVEDDLSPQRESGLSLRNVKLVGGRNGAYYLGSGRGAIYLQNVWALGGGTTDRDALIMLQGYDVVIDNPQVSNSTGFGIYFGEGTQFQVTNGALWDNNVGLGIDGAVNQLSVVGTQIGDSMVDGVRLSGPFRAGNFGAPSLVNVSFKSNGKSGGKGSSDVRVGEGGKVTLIAPDFGGGFGKDFKPTYNVFCDGAPGRCNIQIVAANYVSGKSSGESIANDFSSLKSIQFGGFVADSVKAAGLIQAAGGYMVGSQTGVSCDSPPSLQFQVTKGIVTHC